MSYRASGSSSSRLFTFAAVVALGVAAAASTRSPVPEPSPDRAPLQERILQGRELVISHGCGDCHGGVDNPASEGWLAGLTSPAQEFRIGPCGAGGDESCFRTRPRNLTPHPTTGMGRFSERQIFNSLRYGLRPGETADVEITSTVPGEGNFPMFPKYLAPPMPWSAWRHMSDDQLWAVAAYLKHGLKPVDNFVEDSEGPPDFWASAYTVEAYGSYPMAPFPGRNETEPPGSEDREQVLRGRQLVVQHACGDCHGGFENTEAEGFLVGVTNPGMEAPAGPCREDPGAPCFMLRSSNLTPHPTAGTGRWTDQQLFNALRHGLRPATGPDRPVTASTIPDDAELLGPVMPWTALRHMPDEDLRAVIAYLRHGLKPVDNPVEDSDVPEGGWGPMYEQMDPGSFPAAAFPTRNEVGG